MILYTNIFTSIETINDNLVNLILVRKLTITMSTVAASTLTVGETDASYDGYNPIALVGAWQSHTSGITVTIYWYRSYGLY